MLEVFLKKYGWVANLILLAVAAWLLAKTVNTAIGAAIRPTPRVDSGAGQAAAPAPALATLDVDKLYPLIGQKPPPVVVAGASPDVPPPPKTCSDLQAAPVATSLRAQLIAAIVAEKPLRSVAVIADKGSGQTSTFAIGDEVQGARALGGADPDAVDPSGRASRVVAIVCHDGRKEYVDFGTGGGGAIVPASAPNVGVVPVPPPSGAPPGTPVDGIRKTADNKYDVKKSVLDGTLSNLNAVATQARIVPSFKNGVANGFKVFSIQPNSFYTSIGVENGDVIQKINGYEINSPDKALEISTRSCARHGTSPSTSSATARPFARSTTSPASSRCEGNTCARCSPSFSCPRSPEAKHRLPARQGIRQTHRPTTPPPRQNLRPPRPHRPRPDPRAGAGRHARRSAGRRTRPRPRLPSPGPPSPARKLQPPTARLPSSGRVARRRLTAARRQVGPFNRGLRADGRHFPARLQQGRGISSTSSSRPSLDMTELRLPEEVVRGKITLHCNAVVPPTRPTPPSSPRWTRMA